VSFDIRSIAIEEHGVFLGTTFHPELTGSVLWHAHFISMVHDFAKQ
jgi:glutamine amidotransferase PdxT